MNNTDELNQLKKLSLKNDSDNLVSRVIEAIRFDIDYHLTNGRKLPASQGSLDSNFAYRVNEAINRGAQIFPKNMRKRVFGALMLTGTIENHKLFDQAMSEFKMYLNRHKRKQPLSNTIVA